MSSVAVPVVKNKTEKHLKGGNLKLHKVKLLLTLKQQNQTTTTAGEITKLGL